MFFSFVLRIFLKIIFNFLGTMFEPCLVSWCQCPALVLQFDACSLQSPWWMRWDACLAHFVEACALKKLSLPPLSLNQPTWERRLWLVVWRRNPPMRNKPKPMCCMSGFPFSAAQIHESRTEEETFMFRNASFAINCSKTIQSTSVLDSFLSWNSQLAADSHCESTGKTLTFWVAALLLWLCLISWFLLITLDLPRVQFY